MKISQLFQHFTFTVAFLILLATPPFAFGGESGVETPSQTPAPIDSKKTTPTWEEMREAGLQKVKREREISKNIRNARRFAEQTASTRSRLGQALLSKGPWLRTTTEHFYVFHGEEDEEKAAELAATVESALANARADLGNREIGWAEKAEIILLRDDAFWKNTLRTNTFHPDSFSFPDQLEIYIQPTDEGAINISGSHHIAHLVLGYYLEIEIRAGAPIPAWLGEGLAEYVCCAEENQKRFEKALASNENVPLIRLLTINAPPFKRKDADIFKAEASALIKFITDTYGHKEFRAFVDLLFTSGIPYAYATDTFPTAERARGAFEFLMQNTAMRKDFSSLEAFEKAWLKKSAGKAPAPRDSR